MSRSKQLLMITDSNQACLAKMSGRRVQEGSLVLFTGRSSLFNGVFYK